MLFSTVAMRTKSTEIDLSRMCPSQGCIGGMSWSQNGPAGVCPVCNGEGRVTLSQWMRFTLAIPKASND